MGVACAGTGGAACAGTGGALVVEEGVVLVVVTGGDTEERLKVLWKETRGDDRLDKREVVDCGRLDKVLFDDGEGAGLTTVGFNITLGLEVLEDPPSTTVEFTGSAGAAAVGAGEGEPGGGPPDPGPVGFL